MEYLATVDVDRPRLAPGQVLDRRCGARRRAGRSWSCSAGPPGRAGHARPPPPLVPHGGRRRAPKAPSTPPRRGRPASRVSTPRADATFAPAWGSMVASRSARLPAWDAALLRDAESRGEQVQRRRRPRPVARRRGGLLALTLATAFGFARSSTAGRSCPPSSWPPSPPPPRRLLPPARLGVGLSPSLVSLVGLASWSRLAFYRDREPLRPAHAGRLGRHDRRPAVGAGTTFGTAIALVDPRHGLRRRRRRRRLAVGVPGRRLRLPRRSPAPRCSCRRASCSCSLGPGRRPVPAASARRSGSAAPRVAYALHRIHAPGRRQRLAAEPPPRHRAARCCGRRRVIGVSAIVLA